MENPVAKKDLVDSIVELRSEAERRLMRNKYFVAIKKLDELLEAIQPLEAQVIDEDAELAAEPAQQAALTDETASAAAEAVQAEAVAEAAQAEEALPEAADESGGAGEMPGQAEIAAEAAQVEETPPEPADAFESFMPSGSVLDEFDQKEAETVEDDAALFEPESTEEAPAPAAEQAEPDADFETDEERELQPEQRKVQAAE